MSPVPRIRAFQFNVWIRLLNKVLAQLSFIVMWKEVRKMFVNSKFEIKLWSKLTDLFRISDNWDYGRNVI